MAGDDVSYPHRIERQFEVYNKGSRRLLFSHCDLIDDKSNLIEIRYISELFNRPNKSSEEILNDFYFKGNFLNAITCFTEKEVFNKIGQFDQCLLQEQDLDMWIRALVSGYRIEIVPEKLIKYRIRSNSANLSLPKPETNIRCQLEHYWVLQNFLKIQEVDYFIKVFPIAKAWLNQSGRGLIPFFLAKISLEQPGNVYRLFGIELLRSLLKDHNAADKLYQIYGFGYKDFFSKTGNLDVFQIYPESNSIYYRIQSILQDKNKPLFAKFRFLCILIAKYLLKHITRNTKTAQVPHN